MQVSEVMEWTKFSRKREKVLLWSRRSNTRYTIMKHLHDQQWILCVIDRHAIQMVHVYAENIYSSFISFVYASVWILSKSIGVCAVFQFHFIKIEN